jgi:DnaK suppressor protein
MTAKKDYKNMILPDKYAPKKTEPYMCDEQKAFFYQILTAEKASLTDNAGGDLNLAQKMDSVGAMDEGDAATLSIETDLDIKMQERNKLKIQKIDAALERLENDTFGYSMISGDEIGVKRLMARPVATITLEEQEEKEKQ